MNSRRLYPNCLAAEADDDPAPLFGNREKLGMYVRAGSISTFFPRFMEGFKSTIKRGYIEPLFSWGFEFSNFGQICC